MSDVAASRGVAGGPGGVFPAWPEHEDDVRVIRDFPPLPLPKYAVVRIGCSSEVPAEIASDLRQIGIPAGLIGYERAE